MEEQKQGWMEAAIGFAVMCLVMMPLGVYLTKHVGMGEALLVYDFIMGANATLAMVCGAIASIPDDVD